MEGPFVRLVPPRPPMQGCHRKTLGVMTPHLDCQTSLFRSIDEPFFQWHLTTTMRTTGTWTTTVGRIIRRYLWWLVVISLDYHYLRSVRGRGRRRRRRCPRLLSQHLVPSFPPFRLPQEMSCRIMTPIGSLCLYHGTQGRTDDDNNNNHHHHTVHESPVSDPTTLRRCLLHFLVDAPSCDPFEQRRTTDVDQLFNAFLCVLEGQHTRTTGGKHVPVPYECVIR